MLAGLFDTIGDLPIHPLAAHGAVVLLPLGALAVIAVVLKSSWREKYSVLALATLGAGVLSTIVAKEAGESLANRVGEPEDHAELGEVLPLIAIALMVVALAWWFVSTRQLGTPLIVGILAAGTILLGTSSIAATVVVGHTGAEAVWADRIAGTTSDDDDDDDEYENSEETPSPTPSSTEAPTDAITLAEIQSHSSADDCWAAVDAKVYDLTAWISQHPGGSGAIEMLCGTDATAAFNSEHMGDDDPAAALANFEIGAYAGS